MVEYGKLMEGTVWVCVGKSVPGHVVTTVDDVTSGREDRDIIGSLWRPVMLVSLILYLQDEKNQNINTNIWLNLVSLAS